MIEDRIDDYLMEMGMDDYFKPGTPVRIVVPSWDMYSIAEKFRGMLGVVTKVMYGVANINTSDGNSFSIPVHNLQRV